MKFQIRYEEPHIYVSDLNGRVLHRVIYAYPGQTSYFEIEGQSYVVVVNKYAVVCKMENVSEFLELPQWGLYPNA